MEYLGLASFGFTLLLWLGSRLYDAGKAKERVGVTETRVQAVETRCEALEAKQRAHREEQIMDHQEIEFLPKRVERHKVDMKAELAQVKADLMKRIERLEK